MKVRTAFLMCTLSSFTAACLLAASAVLAPGVAQAEEPAPPPLIAGFGKSAPVENPGEPPDPTLDYKIVMDAVEGGEEGAAPPTFERVARLINMLAQSGVPADHRHIVVMLYGPATEAVLTEEGRKAHKLGPSSSAEAIAKLIAAGVSIRVCGQAVAKWGIARSEILPGVQVDLSAMTTLATLQLKGYAFLPE